MGNSIHCYCGNACTRADVQRFMEASQKGVQWIGMQLSSSKTVVDSVQSFLPLHLVPWYLLQKIYT